MAKEMLINVSEGEECRIALLDDGRLEELYMERTSSTSHVGNIYKGKVTNVEASIQAAFVDFGLGRNGFLHISDLMPTYFGRKGEDIQESVGKKMARRDRPPIQRCLRRGDEIIVQIIKEGIGTKGPTLSTYLSIPGRILVMMPGMGKMGVSKKIEDEEERRRLRTILDSLKPPKGVGFIIRTAGIGKSKAEIQRDLTYLARLWQQIEKKRESGPGPMELYTEGDLVARTVRDVFSSDVDKLIVDNKEVAKRVKEVIKITNPRTRNKVESYDDPIPLFHKYGIEKDIEQMYSRHVPLPSGGSLVIDSTEAIVAIDVNSGKFRDHSDAETTAFKTDMEAADEIPRQLKLRDLGGVIICDFIDLRYERHRRELEEKLHDNFKKDRAKTKVLRMSQFGIIEITRQRMRPSLKRSIYFDCPHCKGAGLVKTPESMSLDAMRKLAMAAHHDRVSRIELSVCPDISFYLLNKKRGALARLEDESHKRISVRSDTKLGLDEMKFDLYDGRDGLIFVEELGFAPQPPHTSQLNTRPAGSKGRRGRDSRNQQRGRHQQPQRRDDEMEMEDREDVMEDREEHRERTPAEEALAASIAPKVVREEATGDLDAHESEQPISDSADHAGEEPPEEEEDQNVVDIEDGHSELGERPAGEWERRDYGDRGGRQQRGRGRGRGRDDRGPGHNQNRQGQGNNQRQQHPQHQNRGPQQQNRQPQNRHPQAQVPPANANSIADDYLDQEDEGPGPGNELHPANNQRDFRGNNHNRRGGQQWGGQRRGQGPGRGPVQGLGQGQYRNNQNNQNRQGGAPVAAPDGGQAFKPSAGQPAGPSAGPLDENGGKRRRRRRGGRRHRRRRERERLAREQAAAAGIPYVPPKEEPGDQYDDDAYDNEPQGGAPSDQELDQQELTDRAPEPVQQREPFAETEARYEPAPEAPPARAEPADEETDEKPAKKKRGGRKSSGSTAPRTRKSPKRTPPRSAKAAEKTRDEPKEEVVKTGSADKHLADDEPADPPPVSRPRRRYDLDAIDDDYD